MANVFKFSKKRTTKKQLSREKNARPSLSNIVTDSSEDTNSIVYAIIQVLWHTKECRESIAKFKDHACCGDECVFCIVQESFAQIQLINNQNLLPHVLDSATISTFNQTMTALLQFDVENFSHFFKQILEKIHFNLTGNKDLISCSALWCVSHTKFAITTVEQLTTCDCTVQYKPVPFTELVRIVCASDLIVHSKRLKSQFSQVVFDRGVFDLALCAATTSTKKLQCPKCTKAVFVKRALITAPDIICIGFKWDTQSVPSIIEAIDTKIQPRKLFDQVISDSIRDTEYCLTSVVTCINEHYLSFCYHTQKKQWICYDKEKVIEVGQSWSCVVKECLENLFQPVFLVYSNPRGEPVDTSQVPTSFPINRSNKMETSNSSPRSSPTQTHSSGQHLSSTGSRESVEETSNQQQLSIDSEDELVYVDARTDHDPPIDCPVTHSRQLSIDSIESSEYLKIIRDHDLPDIDFDIQNVYTTIELLPNESNNLAVQSLTAIDQSSDNQEQQTAQPLTSSLPIPPLPFNSHSEGKPPTPPPISTIPRRKDSGIMTSFLPTGNPRSVESQPNKDCPASQSATLPRNKAKKKMKKMSITSFESSVSNSKPVKPPPRSPSCLSLNKNKPVSGEKPAVTKLDGRIPPPLPPPRCLSSSTTPTGDKPSTQRLVSSPGGPSKSPNIPPRPLRRSLTQPYLSSSQKLKNDQNQSKMLKCNIPSPSSQRCPPIPPKGHSDKANIQKPDTSESVDIPPAVPPRMSPSIAHTKQELPPIPVNDLQRIPSSLAGMSLTTDNHPPTDKPTTSTGFTNGQMLAVLPTTKTNIDMLSSPCNIRKSSSPFPLGKSNSHLLKILETSTTFQVAAVDSDSESNEPSGNEYLEATIRGLPKHVQDPILHCGLCIWKASQSDDPIMIAILLDLTINQLQGILNQPSVIRCSELYLRLQTKNDDLKKQMHHLVKEYHVDQARFNQQSLASLLSDKDSDETSTWL